MKTISIRDAYPNHIAYAVDSLERIRFSYSDELAAIPHLRTAFRRLWETVAITREAYNDLSYEESRDKAMGFLTEVDKVLYGPPQAGMPTDPSIESDSTNTGSDKENCGDGIAVHDTLARSNSDVVEALLEVAYNWLLEMFRSREESITGLPAARHLALCSHRRSEL